MSNPYLHDVDIVCRTFIGHATLGVPWGVPPYELRCVEEGTPEQTPWGLAGTPEYHGKRKAWCLDTVDLGICWPYPAGSFAPEAWADVNATRCTTEV